MGEIGPPQEPWQPVGIRAIPTTVKGIRYRSRLEAKWGVFFEMMGIDFLYEPQGFELSTGERYLPDFYLKQIRCFAEAKPEWDNPAIGRDLRRAQAFVEAGMAEKIMFLIGEPAFKPYTILRRLELPDGSESWVTNCHLDIYNHPRWYFEEHRLFEDFPEDDFKGYDKFSDEYRHAVFAAQNAQFHGPERVE